MAESADDVSPFLVINELDIESVCLHNHLRNDLVFLFEYLL